MPELEWPIVEPLVELHVAATAIAVVAVGGTDAGCWRAVVAGAPIAGAVVASDVVAAAAGVDAGLDAAWPRWVASLGNCQRSAIARVERRSDRPLLRPRP